MVLVCADKSKAAVLLPAAVSHKEMSPGKLATGGGISPNWNDFVIKHFVIMSSILIQIVAGKRFDGKVSTGGRGSLLELAFAAEE